MAAEEHSQESADFGEISVNLIEEKQFILDPYLFGLSGNNIQQYCTMLSLMDFQNCKPEMSLITEEGIETPLSLVQVVEEFEIEPSLCEGDGEKQTRQSDPPQQENPTPVVNLKYNLMHQSDEGVVRVKLSSDVSFSEPQQGTNLQKKEYEFMSYVNDPEMSSEPLQVHPILKEPVGDTANPKQKSSHQPTVRCYTSAQPNECMASQNIIQNAAGLNAPPGKWVHHKKHDVEERSIQTTEKCVEKGSIQTTEKCVEKGSTQTTEKCQCCKKSGESSNEPVSFLVRPNARCSIIHQLAPAEKRSCKCPSKDHSSSIRSVIGHQIIVTNEWEKLFSRLSLSPSHLKDPVKKFFKCPNCGKDFARKSSIYRHLKRRHGKGNTSLNFEQERSFSQVPGHCPDQKVNLKKPLSCPDMVKSNAKSLSGQSQKCTPPNNDCGTSSAPDLESQMDCTNEKTFQCSICGKTFATKSSLVRHELLHKPEKPFKCLLCNKSYTQKCHLKRHAQKHHVN